MRKLLLLSSMLVAGCSYGAGNFTNDPKMFADLAKDPNTACIHIAAVPPYFGGFVWIRESPTSSGTIECGGDKIAGPATITPVGAAVAH